MIRITTQEPLPKTNYASFPDNCINVPNQTHFQCAMARQETFRHWIGFVNSCNMNKTEGLKEHWKNTR
jgi:hypothetical protein